MKSIVALVASLVLWPLVVLAQAPDPFVSARVHIGPFAVNPSISLANVGLDTNVFNEVVDPKKDFTATITPERLMLAVLPLNSRDSLQARVTRHPKFNWKRRPCRFSMARCSRACKPRFLPSMVPAYGGSTPAVNPIFRVGLTGRKDGESSIRPLARYAEDAVNLNSEVER